MSGRFLRALSYDPGVIPLLLVLAGGVAVLAGIATLRTLGTGYRLGRLLATVPRVPVSEAVRLAKTGERRFVGIQGRIEGENEFEDAAHQPLVWRRTRLQARLGRRWMTFEDGVEVVPFEVHEGLDGIAIDTAALGPGVVVLTRESVGVVSDLADRAPAELPPEAPARARIDQISSIEHATVLGWPVRTEAGEATMTSGGGRPLVLSTLEPTEAMRVLAGGDRVRPWLATILLVGGLVIGALGLAWYGLEAAGLVTGSTGSGPAAGLTDGLPRVEVVRAAAAASSASPAPTVPAPTVPAATLPAATVAPLPSDLGGDTRSSGSGPGLVGAPGLAIAAVIGLGIVAAVATLAYVRLTGGPRRG